MSWLGLLLVGIALTDLVFSIRPRAWLPQCIAAVAVIGLGLVAGLTDALDLVALVVIVGVVLTWGRAVTHGFGRDRPGVPLLLLGCALTAAVLLSGLAGEADGPLQTWLDDVDLPPLAGTDADRALLLLGALGIQLSTGNVLVRLVLAVTGTLNPAKHGTSADPEVQLKGGRLLGPMERVFILSLGLAGQVTAASIVVAAKGLLRFPELSSRREQERIHQLTEYFLVGSFASWLIALAGVVVLST
ncbi:hypothetical protein ncot_12175 [Nocardioides sp. JQ2195]|uniref:hypothetical protein n=1 Tax=Nocardioides sp. JQ2195 TaxID=2592334 RepID=UPI00143E4FA4|nr:hypothetical protein [Nocardioides sp. JQ2195]QIX27271.1 hypothetical protein ncot_12175 [Nocardioides sp. JQ2195]